MVYTTENHYFYLALICSLCFYMPFLNSQSSLLSLASVTPSINDSLENSILHSVDGPYLFRGNKECKVIMVIQKTNDFKILEESIDPRLHPSLSCMVDNQDKDIFEIPIMDKIKVPKSTYKRPEKLLAISDIEGNFNAFYGILVANGVMDKQYKWTYGKGHLVLIGDFMDRGDNVTQVLWLIYKLEQEAKEKGGVVHFVLGNHEILNLEGKTNYVDKKYIKLAKRISGKSDEQEAYLSLMAKNQELVKWMKSKNSIEKIGNILFVHGGISPQLVKAGFPIDLINETIRRRLNYGPSNNKLDRMDEDFLMASHGPLWFRGLATRYRNFYQKATEEEVNDALKHFRVKHIAIGHTITKEVSFDFGGKVIRTDVKHGLKKDSPDSQALLFFDNQFFRVDATGKKTAL